MSNKALIVVDLQREFVGYNHDFVEKIIGLAKTWPTQDVFWMVYQNAHDSLFIRHLGWDECIHSPESSLIRAKGLEQHNIVEHHSYSFPLETIIQWQGKYKDVVLCGADTDACLLATAFNLWDYKIRPIILADYCLSSDGDEFHLPALKIMKRQFGEKSVLYGSYTAQDFLG